MKSVDVKMGQHTYLQATTQGQIWLRQAVSQYNKVLDSTMIPQP